MEIFLGKIFVGSGQIFFAGSALLHCLCEGLPEVIVGHWGCYVDFDAAYGVGKLHTMALQAYSAIGIAALSAIFQVALDGATYCR